MARNFEELIEDYRKESDCFKKDKKFLVAKAAAKTFDQKMVIFAIKKDEAHEIYGRLDEDDDFLGQACDSARTIYLGTALKVATTKAQCQRVLDCTLERNIEIRQQIIDKMDTLPD